MSSPKIIAPSEGDFLPPAKTFEERMARRREREAKAKALAEVAPPVPSSPTTLRWRSEAEGHGLLADTTAIFKLSNGFVISGAVLIDGRPTVFDIIENRFIPQPSWKGFVGWMPITDLPA